MEFWLIIVCLILSGFFSGAETVFLSVNRIRLEGFLHKRRAGAKSAVWLMKNPSRFILTTLVGTNLANIAFATILTAYLVARGVPSMWITPIGTLVILIFGEVIPKSLGRDLADSASLWTAPILRFFLVLFYPLNKIGDWVSKFAMSLFGFNQSEVKTFFTRHDLETLIRESAEYGSLKTRRKSDISKILDFRSLNARDVMTPRTDIIALESSASLEELRQTALSSGFSKIPIYNEDIDHIVGVAFARDLFDEPEELSDIIRPINYSPEQSKAWEIFRELRANHQSITIIVDEWGGTAGIITVEDLIEELTGEIEDEYDHARLTAQWMEDGRLLVSARMEVDEINRQFDLDIPEGEYETLGGYLIDLLGRIPSKGEIIKLDKYHCEILKATRTRIRIVIIEKLDGTE